MARAIVLVGLPAALATLWSALVEDGAAMVRLEMADAAGAFGAELARMGGAIADPALVVRVSLLLDQFVFVPLYVLVIDRLAREPGDPPERRIRAALGLLVTSELIENVLLWQVLDRVVAGDDGPATLMVTLSLCKWTAAALVATLLAVGSRSGPAKVTLWSAVGLLSVGGILMHAAVLTAGMGMFLAGVTLLAWPRAELRSGAG